MLLLLLFLSQYQSNLLFDKDLYIAWCLFHFHYSLSVKKYQFTWLCYASAPLYLPNNHISACNNMNLKVAMWVLACNQIKLRCHWLGTRLSLRSFVASCRWLLSGISTCSTVPVLNGLDQLTGITTGVEIANFRTKCELYVVNPNLWIDWLYTF